MFWIEYFESFESLHLGYARPTQQRSHDMYRSNLNVQPHSYMIPRYGEQHEYARSLVVIPPDLETDMKRNHVATTEDRYGESTTFDARVHDF